MTASVHFSFEDLADFVEGRLTPEAMRAIEAHLADGCAECTDNVAFLRRMTQAAEAAAWSAPPARVHRQAVRVFQSSSLSRRRGIRPLIWRPLLAALVLVAILIGLAYSLTPSAAYAASVVEVSGRVEVQLSPDAAWQAAAQGQTFPVGAAIRTADGGQAALIFPGTDRVHLAPETRLQLTTLARTDGQWQIALDQASGETENWVQPETSVYRVYTETGEAVANGTRFGVKVEADGSTVVSVTEGKVTIRAALGAVVISAGQAAISAPGGRPIVLSSAISTPSPAPTEIDTSEDVGTQEADGQNNDVDGGATVDVGTPEADGQNNGVDGGAVEGVGTPEADGQNSGVDDGTAVDVGTQEGSQSQASTESQEGTQSGAQSQEDQNTPSAPESPSGTPEDG